MENLKPENKELISSIGGISSVVTAIVLMVTLGSFLYLNLVNKPITPMLAIAISTALVLLVLLYLYQFYLVATMIKIKKKMEDYDLNKPIVWFID